MWLVGHWQVDNRSTTQPAYQQVADRRGQWGTPVSVSVSGGQQPGQRFFTGSQATVRFIDLPTPSEDRHIPHHGQGIAVCWVDEDNPENTVAVFNGYVTGVERVQHPSPTGTPWQALEVTAQDWFGYWSQNYPDNDPGQPDDAWELVQRRVCRHFGRLQAVRLGRFEDTRICAACFEEGFFGGDNIREANIATGTEAFQRAGRMIGQEPYPTDGTTVTGWWVRTPQIVIRRRTGEAQGDDTIGGSTTADQEIVAFSNIIREPGGIEVVAASESTTVPKIPAFTPPRITEQRVAEPAILHYVELTPGDSAGLADNPGVVATQQSADGWRQDKFVRTARLSRNDDAHRAALQIAANRFVEGQTSHFDAIEVTVESLEPDEIEQWSKRSLGDEIILDSYRAGASPQRCMIRRMDWDINPGNATNITVSATPHISPPALARYTGDLIWRDGAFSSGYDFGPPRLGSLTPDRFDVSGTEVRLRAILRRNDNGRVTVETETVAQMNLLEGWWLQLQLPSGRTENIEIGDTSSQIWTSEGEEIAAADTPDDGDTVRVSLFDQFPTSVIPAPTATVPNVVGLTRAAAADAIRFAGLVPVGTEVTATSEADDDRTLTQFPTAGTPAVPGATVAFDYGSYTDVTQVAVPNVGNDTEADARATLVGAGLVVGTVTDENETSGADDRVIRTIPAAGTIVGVGSTVNIVLRNLVTTTRTVPVTAGFTEAAARTALTNAGFVVGTVTNEDVTTGVDDTVLRTVPAEGSSVAEGSTVNIVLRNLQAVVPDLDGQTETQARAALVALGFVVGAVTDENTTTGTDDTVIRTSPAAGSQINVGSTVGLVLRNLQVLVPDVAGQTDAAARTAITNANLVPGTTTDENQISGTDDRVIRTDPPAGSQVDDGTTVNIVLRNLQAIVPDLTGDTVTEAMAALTAVGLVLDTVFGTDVNTLVQGNDDRVHSQSVAAGSQVDDGTVVRVTLWNYNGAVVPNLVGLSRTAALAALTAVGLTGTPTSVDTLVQAQDELVQTQAVAAGTTVVSGSAVAFVYADYVGVTVPDLAGLTGTAAAAALTAVGLVAAEGADVTVTVAAQNDLVQQQSPAAGMIVASGSTVTYQLGDFVGTVVPNTVGLSETVARATIGNAGLVVGTVTDEDENFGADDAVIRTVPAAGTEVEPGSTVNIVVRNLVPVRLWNAILTVGPSVVGWSGFYAGNDEVDPPDPALGALSDDDFTVQGTDVTIQLLQWNSTNDDVRIRAGSAAQAQALTAGVFRIEFTGTAAGEVFFSPTIASGNQLSGNNVLPDNITLPAEGTQIAVEYWSAQPATSTPTTGYPLVPTTVPDVTGLTEAAARTAITGAGLVVGTVTDEDDNFGTDDRVIRTSPAAGAQVQDGSTVNIVLRNLVPAAFWNAILTVGSDGDWSGYYSADYPPTPTEPGTGALSDDDFEVLGLDHTIWRLEWDTTNDRIAIWADDAEEALSLALGWFRIEFTGTTAGDLIFNPGPASRNLNALQVANILPDNITFPSDGTQIAVSWWSAEPDSPARTPGYPLLPEAPQVAVPDVSGLLEAAARTAIENANLVVSFTDQDETSGTDNEVISQTPAAGTMVDQGSTVTVTIRNLVAAPTPQQLWTTTLTVGTSGAWHGYFDHPTTPSSDYGSLADDDFTHSSTDITVSRIDWHPASRNMRLWAGNGAQATAITGLWVRVELTGANAGDGIFQLQNPGGSNNRRFSGEDAMPEIDSPADLTQIAVSVYDIDPTGEDNTSGYPIAPATVPDLTGLLEGAARTAVTNAGLVPDFSDVNQTSGTNDEVISQSPAAGTVVLPGSTVTAEIRNLQAVIPTNIVGMTEDAARTALSNLGFLVAAETTDVDTLVEADDDKVQATSPAAGSQIDYGSTVSLVLWNYHGVTVPDFVGDPIADVVTDVAALGLVLVQSDVDVFVAAQDNVVQTQDPDEDTIVAPGSTVTVTVGNLKVRVPAIVGSTQEDAQDALTAAGLTFTFTEMEVTDENQVGLVQSQLPAESAVVDPGSNVAFVVGIAVPTVFPLWTATMTGTTQGAWWGYDNRANQNEGSALSDTVAEDIEDADGNDVDVTIIHIDINDDVGGGQARMRLWTETAAQMNAIEGKWLRIELTDDIADDLIAAVPASNTRASIDIDNLTQADIPADGTRVAVSIWENEPPADRTSTPNLPSIDVPDLAGLTETAADAAVVAAGLVVGANLAETDVTDSAQENLVQSQFPTAGTSVAVGSTVQVSLGNLVVAVPDLSGLTATAAEAALTAVGLVGAAGDDIDVSDEGQDDLVQQQSPAAAALVDPGSTVTYQLGNFVAATDAVFTATLVVADHGGGLNWRGYRGVSTTWGSPPFGSLTPNTFDIGGTMGTVTLWQFGDGTTAARRWMQVGLEGDFDDADTPSNGAHVWQGKWVKVTFPTGDPFIVQVPDSWNGQDAIGTMIDMSLDWPEAGDTLTVELFPMDPTPPVTQVAVPDLTGLLEAAARTAIEDAGLVAAFTSQDQTSGTDDEVISQTPAAGTMVDTGSTVNVVIRNLVAVPQVAVPDVSDHTQTAAETDIEAAGLVVGTVTFENVTTGTDNRVLRTDPAAGTLVDPGSTVNIVLRNLQVAIPDVIGDTVDDATAALTTAGLLTSATFGTDVNTLVQADDNKVHSTTPVVGSIVDTGSTVTLTLWNYHGVSVPALVGLSVAQATSALTALNLAIGTAGAEIDVTDEDHNDVIRAQDPAANEIVAPGTAVNYQLGRLVVPDLDGLTQAEAETALTTAGLVGTATDVNTTTQSLDNTVVTDSQMPAAGLAVQPGDAVTYRLYNYVTAPTRVSTATITFGESTVGNTLYRGWSDGAFLAGVGSVSPDPWTFTVGGTEVDVDGLYTVATTGRTQFSVETFTQANAIVAGGLWLKLVLPGTSEAVVTELDSWDLVPVFEFTIPTSDVPASGETVTAEVWDAEPIATVPDIDGLTQTAAENALVAAGLVVGTVGMTDTTFGSQEGLVQTQTPAAGARVDTGTSVDFTLGRFVAIWSATIDWGSDGDQSGYDAPGGSQAFGSIDDDDFTVDSTAVEIDALIRRGDGTIRIVVGTNAELDALQNKYLKLALPSGDIWARIPVSDNNVTDTIRLIPNADVPADGTEVNVELWRGLPDGVSLTPVADPEPVAVPDVSGLSEAAARTAIEGAGLVVVFTDEDQTTGTDNEVISQSPSAGTPVAPGSTVNVTIRNLVSSDAPNQLWRTLITWGRHPEANIDRQGYASVGSDSGTVSYGALSDTVETIDGVSVTIRRFAELFSGNDGKVRIDTGSADQYAALAGNWFRLETTGEADGDMIWQVEAEPGSAGDTTTNAVITRALVEGSRFVLTLWDGDPTGQPRDSNMNLPFIPTALWSETLVWGVRPEADDSGHPREGYAIDHVEGTDEGYGALTPGSVARRTDQESDTSILTAPGSTASRQLWIRALRRLDSGVIEIHAGSVSQTVATRALQIADLADKWLRIELPDDPDGAVVQIPANPGDDETTTAVVIDATERATIGRGTQLAVSIWQDNPTGAPATEGFPIKLPTGALTAAAIFCGERGNWFGWHEDTGTPLNSYGTCTPRDTGYPWAFNHNGEEIVLRRLDLRSNRKIRLWGDNSTEDITAMADLWLRVDMPNVDDPVVASLDPATDGTRVVGGGTRIVLDDVLPENPDVPDNGEVFLASLWTTEAAARAG